MNGCAWCRDTEWDDDDYDNGFAAGIDFGIELAEHRYRQAEKDLANKKADIEYLKMELAEAKKLLKAAVEIWDAYGDDEGYTPSRVEEQARLLEKAGLVKRGV